MTRPLVTIVLPTWNGEEDLRRLLPALARQTLAPRTEIRAVDSSSSDRSRELLAEAGADVQRIDQADFSHSETRNRCAEQARGRFLVFLSQDATPVDEHFLERLLEPFDDPRVAGAYSRVLPFPTDDPLTARTVLSLPEASEEGYVRDLDGVEGVWQLSAPDRARYLHFNNVSSAIRTDVFRRIPFPATPFGEDFAWAVRALTWGWRIAYAPRATVYHAHNYSLSAAYARYRVDAGFHREMHGFRVRPNLLSVVKGILYEVRQDLKFVLRSDHDDKLRHLLRSPGLRTAMVLGQYAGSQGW